jgi:alanyl-tRNA synthetase
MPIAGCVLVSQKLVTVKRIAQDGTRVRASAGRKSFRGRDRLEELRDEMAAHVAEVKDPAAMKPSRREREAQARLSRIDQALETLKALEEAKAKQKNKPSKQNPPQASTTDPEARMMRMGDGGMRPGYNVQIAVDIQSRAVVGAEVTSCGSDAQESARMRAQVNERTGQKVHRHAVRTTTAHLAAQLFSQSQWSAQRTLPERDTLVARIAFRRAR